MQVAAAQLSVKAAQAALDELLAGATAAEQRAADGALSSAIARQEAAEARHALLLLGAKSEQIAVAETGVEQARAAVAEAELAVEQAQAGVVQAEAGLAQAEAAVQAARVALDQMTLKASFDGTIADLPAELGQVVGPGMPAVVLADLSGWLVETTDLTELDVAAVAVGASAEVEMDALPGRVLDGTVTEIASVSSLVRGDVTYVVTVRLDEYRDLPLRWGMTASVNVAATSGAAN
jgi:multidrug resistance efflux pump